MTSHSAIWMVIYGETHLHVTMLASVGRDTKSHVPRCTRVRYSRSMAASTLVLGELHDTYGVVTQRTRQDQMCLKLEKGAHKKQSELWDVGYKHEYPFARQWVAEGHQEVDHVVWW